MKFQTVLLLLLVLSCLNSLSAEHPQTAKKVTSLTNPSVSYSVPEKHYVTLKAADVTAIIVDNEAVDIPALPGHRAGYNGIASLKHQKNGENLFVSTYAGLNFEHIHDGTKEHLKEKFEPRKFPMQLRIVNESTVELYQPATENFQLESCGRYHLNKDGTIEYTFECIPRKESFAHGYIGLFWASYINAPEDKSIYFWGEDKQGGTEKLIQAITPKHGVEAVHVPKGTQWFPTVNTDFPLSLVGNQSQYVYTKPTYYGVRDGLAFQQSFENCKHMYFVQSPSGGGNGNPAWDFEWFVPNYQVGEAYGFTMTAKYEPLKKNPE